MVPGSINSEPLERLKVSNGLSNFVPDLIVVAVQNFRLQSHSCKAFVASALTDKVINVLQNPRNRIPVVDQI